MDYLQTINLKNLILIASGQSNYDFNFKNTVILLHEDDEKGTSGVVLNRLTSFNLDDLINKTEVFDWVSKDLIEKLLTKKPLNKKVLAGGPVANQFGFFLQKNTDTNNSVKIIPATELLLEQFYFDKNFEHQELFFGFVFWPKGQLENEIKNDYWQLMPVDFDFVTKTSCLDKYYLACKKIGYNDAVFYNYKGIDIV